jgi:hypothetical protein
MRCSGLTDIAASRSVKAACQPFYEQQTISANSCSRSILPLVSTLAAHKRLIFPMSALDVNTHAELG